ncbi:hypothetical protein I0C86_23745 [Plantactinospora sp. S1510]|uniref:Uncharacterized protein n=1 Tax=Plantactinospora alkalitolerans TaxID=2789879 RepID=A0ABS0H0T6_9ACTN|nr:permease prefix domain 1-containing protein [Plantactinospora alkalitolerans]MBF9131954.1 hypothetical protein [Plantactinospora alkalitolerans]
MNSLTDRYLAATLPSVPSARREEIAVELRGSIEDMIEDRTGNGQDPGTAEREVLTELGNPERLAARYADRRLQLIGPTYYLVWLRLLRLLLSFVPAIVGTVDAVSSAATGEVGVGGAIGSGIGTAIEVAVHIAFWLTLTFAILERTTPVQGLGDWNVDQLPRVPVDREMSLASTATAVAWLLFGIAYLPLQHFQSWIESDSGANIPIIDPALWSSWLPVLLAVLVGSVVFEIVKYRVGRWTWPLIGVNVALHLAFAVPVAWLILSDRLLSPEFVQRFEWLREGDNLGTVANVTAVVLAVVVIWDVLDSVRAIRRRHA